MKNDLWLPDGSANLAAPRLWAPGAPFGALGVALGATLGRAGFKVGAIEGWNTRGIGAMFNIADVLAAKILDHINGKTAHTLVTPNYVALLTGTALQADTGVTITTTNNVEASYTGYARLSLAASDYNAAAAGAHPPNATVSFPVAQKTWPACTAGTSVVTNWCIVLGTSTARANAGDISFFGTCTSTTISTTQTPPTVAANGFTDTAT